MRLVAPPLTGSQGARYIIAKLCRCTAIPTTQGDRDNRLSAPGAVFAAVEAVGFERVGDVAGYADSLNLCPGFQRVRMISLYTNTIWPTQRVCAQCACLNGENRIFLAMISAQWMGLIA